MGSAMVYEWGYRFTEQAFSVCQKFTDNRVPKKAVTASVTERFPSSRACGLQGNGYIHYFLNHRKERGNSMSTGIRAREAATACHFTGRQCMAWCAYNSPEGCELLADVPDGETPRDWYLRMLSEVAQ